MTKHARTSEKAMLEHPSRRLLHHCDSTTLNNAETSFAETPTVLSAMNHNLVLAWISAGQLCLTDLWRMAIGLADNGEQH
ncbi:unnamed protein product [Caenorhabditis auriculariae]|uniref:Uncharacterized protein n=1 Tax=Caenorhabditis auriculariae TaxID=2777116 RepID=A0A8S1H1F7_9PELO|nr:unnamed protein product [Caenorhabditis auriculariae]